MVPYFKQKKIEVKINKSFPPEIKDMSPLLKEAKALNVDAFCAAAYPEEGMLLTGQALSLALTSRPSSLPSCPFPPTSIEITLA